jgi:hypothetical protein
MNSINITASVYSGMLEAQEQFKTLLSDDYVVFNIQLVTALLLETLLIAYIIYVCTECYKDPFNSDKVQKYFEDLKCDLADSEENCARYAELYDEEVKTVEKLQKDLDTCKSKLHETQVSMFSLQMRYQVSRDAAKKFVDSFPSIKED